MHVQFRQDRGHEGPKVGDSRPVAKPLDNATTKGRGPGSGKPRITEAAEVAGNEPRDFDGEAKSRVNAWRDRLEQRRRTEGPWSTDEEGGSSLAPARS